MTGDFPDCTYDDIRGWVVQKCAAAEGFSAYLDRPTYLTIAPNDEYVSISPKETKMAEVQYTEKVVVKEKDKWCVVSADKSRRFGSYDNEADADEKLGDNLLKQKKEADEASLTGLSVGMTVDAAISILGKPTAWRKYRSIYQDETYSSDTLQYRKDDSDLFLRFSDGTLSSYDYEEGVLVYKADERIEERLDFEVKFASVDSDKQLVYGVVMEPDEIDTHGDITSANEIEKAAHYFMQESQVMGDSHIKVADATPVESYIAPVDFTLGGQEVKKGSWIMTTKIHADALWEEVKKGDYTGYSIGAYVHKRPIEEVTKVAVIVPESVSKAIVKAMELGQVKPK